MYRLRWSLASLCVLVACGDDIPDASSSASTSGTSTSEATTLPGTSTMLDTTAVPDTTMTVETTVDPETTAGLDATAEGTTSTGPGSTTTLDDGTTTTDGATESTGPAVEPIALPDGACMLRQQPSLLITGALDNDSDPQDSAVVLVGVDPMSMEGGTIVAMGNDFVYTPPASGFWGEDVFSYTIEDPEGNQGIGQVHVMVWPGPIDATELVADAHGLAISPDVSFGRLGWSVAGNGDLDGDGYDDVVVSAPFSWNGQGRIYVVFGRPDPTSIPLTDVAGGIGGYVVYGDDVAAYTGWSVAVLPDLDGDGNDDLAIGAGWSSANGNRSGRVAVIFSQDFGATMSLSSLLLADGFAIDGAEAEEWAGWSVDALDDLDGDGIAEILVGAPQATDVLPGAGGRAYVVFGKTDATPVSLASVLAGTGGGLALLGQPADHVGWAVKGLHDLSGDGLPEILAGSYSASGSAGRAYVTHGPVLPATIDLAMVAAGVGGWDIQGASGGLALGRALGELGDLDGDGRSELVVAAPGPAFSGDSAVHVLYGSGTTGLVLGAMPPDRGVTLPGLVPGDDLGWSVASLDDFNGDGWPDLALGAPSAIGGQFGNGAVYVVFGREDLSTIDLAEVAQGRGGFVVTGEDWDDEAGWSVASAGDFDGDGSTDLLLGAPLAEPMGGNSGRAYLVLGVTPSWPELGACVPE
ncbi:Ig-like domain-containing protein [Paraliomyxa miuraensis]|uniref:Ig-like domain-containing protein n=1 Tax=Paraliomyxa miuraensis TaxID=376150 RepID=UPI002256B333|nr:Ig-like domain-containing protein [Paraliomyxa miuraensis]MCX4242826.1 FG-GAP-like repeat-containing protein [Paraliomyxa miuraensis]